MHHGISQNNVTRDVAVLSQMTNTIRLYGTDCNQTQMLIHSIRQLRLENTVKIWLGVWQDGNATTNARQLVGLFLLCFPSPPLVSFQSLVLGISCNC